MSTAEWIHQIALFDNRGLLSWRVLSLRAPWLSRSRLLGYLSRRRGVTFLLGVRLACAAAVVFPLQNPLRIAVLIAIAVTGSIFRYRKWLSDDGADEMGQIVTIGAAMTAIGLSMQDLLVAFSGTLLIAGQLIIAYFLAGTAKLASYEWRSGRAIVGIMGTRNFGHDFAARVASSSAAFPVAFCWLVIVSEATFPLVVLCPHPVLLAFLAAFALFHVATGLFMGLNTYVWSFLAAYPSVWMINAAVLAATNHG